MCGLVAFFNKDKQAADPSILRRMAERIAYRGPDEEGELVEGPLGLAHKRLAVIDLSLIHISEPTRLLSISYAVFCLKKKNSPLPSSSRT